MEIEEQIEIYEALLKKGEELEQHPLLEEEKREETQIKNCQSKVYVVMDGEGDRRVLRGESDSLIIGGILQIIFERMNKLTVEEAKKESWDFLLKNAAIYNLLSPSRREGLSGLIAHIQKLYD